MKSLDNKLKKISFKEIINRGINYIKKLPKNIIRDRKKIGSLLLFLSGFLIAITLESHIKAIITLSPTYSVTGFILFCITLIGVITMFNAFSLKKRNTVFMFVMTLIVFMLLSYSVFKYSSLIIENTKEFQDIVFDSAKKKSIAILIIGVALNLLSVILFSTCLEKKVKEE
ncbi:hypothetical protein BN85406410 [Alteracholeplasma palmae J233]|uniref:Uncharacterized protein n=1 Tax=Alteracholeplasma palmae (strain ATCC 49389 / J233) TaxID=1318466 RepID=U4KKQ4_ALTPJ|nr:hypothetical protein [Alteracholeplasma palmae]CCV64218.1 hypothetical protein BN85406410 [Alteracholeplasma palmae J233]